jgi:hypothetical protein
MASERARQKKLERKHRKRQEKKRGLRLAGPFLSAPPPMSTTLAEFAAPLLDRVPDPPSHEDWTLVLNLAAMVWNTVDGGLNEAVMQAGQKVFDSFGWKDDVGEELRRLLARKKAHFSWEPRLVAGVEVEDRGDTLHVVTLSKLT